MAESGAERAAPRRDAPHAAAPGGLATAPSDRERDEVPGERRGRAEGAIRSHGSGLPRRIASRSAAGAPRFGRGVGAEAVAAAPPAYAGLPPVLWALIAPPSGARSRAAPCATDPEAQASARLLEAVRREALWWPIPHHRSGAARRLLIDPGGPLGALKRALAADGAAGEASDAVLLAEGRGAAAAALARRFGLEAVLSPNDVRPDALERVRATRLGPEALWAAIGPPTLEPLTAPQESGSAFQAAIDAALGPGALRRRDPWSGAACDPEEALTALRFFAERAAGRARPVVTTGLSPWKRRNVDPFLRGPAGPARHRRDPAAAAALARSLGGAIALWGSSRERAEALRREGVDVLLLEDGFIRSVGLGVQHERPASLCVAGRALHFEADRVSDFREMLRSFAPDAALRARASAFRRLIVEQRVSKYSPRDHGQRPPPTTRDRVLVVGQVEGDASLRFGFGYPGGNLELLRAVRRRRPRAMILYKPHPDVVAGMRRDAAGRAEIERLADYVAPDLGPLEALDWADAVETMTSQLGFEALLWEKPVTCHGAPFYSGLGLTTDLRPRPDSFTCDLERLVAAAFLVYPLYVSPGARTPCPAERAVLELAAQRAAPPPRWEGLWKRAISKALNLKI